MNQKEEEEKMHSSNECTNATSETEAVVLNGIIVLVAKCPLAGSSKTRLRPLFLQGECNSNNESEQHQQEADEKCAAFAKAMLCDVLVNVGTSDLLQNVLKILLYAPGDDNGKQHMESILDELNLQQQSSDSCYRSCWHLIPMLTHVTSTTTTNTADETTTTLISASATINELRSTNLTEKLSDALIKARQYYMRVNNKTIHSSTDYDGNGCDCSSDNNNNNNNVPPVVFLGMDSPEVCPNEISSALHWCSTKSTDCIDNHHRTAGELKAFICPSDDGGYGMLALGTNKNNKVFEGVRWSNPLTFASQCKALSDCGITQLKIGQLMYDMDEPCDIHKLIERSMVTKKKGEKTTDEQQGKKGKQQQQEQTQSQSQETSSADNEGADALLRPSTFLSSSLSSSFPYYTYRQLMEFQMI